MSSKRQNSQDLQLNAVVGISDVGALGNWMRPTSTFREVPSCLDFLLYQFLLQVPECACYWLCDHVPMR